MLSMIHCPCCSVSGSMPPALPAAATGGLAAAFVSSLFQEPQWPLPLTCQDLQPDLWHQWHLPSLLVGLFIGLFVIQLLDLLHLIRQALSIYVRGRSWGLQNSALVRCRLG